MREYILRGSTSQNFILRILWLFPLDAKKYPVYLHPESNPSVLMDQRSHSISTLAGLTGVIAYLSPIGWGLAFIIHLLRKEEYPAFHLRQAGGIYLTLAALLFLSRIPYFGWLMWLLGLILCFFLWVVGFMGAVQSYRTIIPYLGPYFQNWFNISRFFGGYADQE
jgi:uncharacterized membrane protein